MQRQYTSRLARRQGKKIIRQSTRMIILAILGVILFIFVIMPQVVQLFFRLFGTGDLSPLTSDTVPPQVPVFNLTRGDERGNTGNGGLW